MIRNHCLLIGFPLFFFLKRLAWSRKGCGHFLARQNSIPSLSDNVVVEMDFRQREKKEERELLKKKIKRVERWCLKRKWGENVYCTPPTRFYSPPFFLFYSFSTSLSLASGPEWSNAERVEAKMAAHIYTRWIFSFFVPTFSIALELFVPLPSPLLSSSFFCCCTLFLNKRTACSFSLEDPLTGFPLSSYSHLRFKSFPNQYR